MNEFGIYCKQAPTGPYTREDVEALHALPIARLREQFEAVVEAAIRRNRKTIEAKLRRDNETLGKCAWLTFARWRADVLLGKQGTATRPFVADADDQEQDAHAALFIVRELTRAMDARDVEAAARLSYLLGRTAERFQVRPYEPLLRAPQARLRKQDESAEERKKRDEAMRRVKSDHPDWTAAQIQKHSPLLKRFPEVEKLTTRRVLAILAGR